MAKATDRLAWVDCEMTGLDPERDVILEIACVITDKSLQLVEAGPSIVINQPKRVLDRMGTWCKRQHGKSGLVEEVLKSTVANDQAEKAILTFVRKHCLKGVSPLCGNSVWYDRIFLARHMPTLNTFFHYQIVDVSSIKLLAKYWYPKEAKPPSKSDTHRAMPDILESIEELRWYRKMLWR